MNKTRREQRRNSAGTLRWEMDTFFLNDCHGHDLLAFRLTVGLCDEEACRDSLNVICPFRDMVPGERRSLMFVGSMTID